MSETDVPIRDRMDRMQQRRYDVLTKQWRGLDREHFDLVSIEAEFIEDTDPATPIEERLAVARWAMRAHHHALMTLFQEVEQHPVETLEEHRIAGLNHETERSGYRLSARPFIHTDRWWEPGYLDWDGRP